MTGTQTQAGGKKTREDTGRRLPSQAERPGTHPPLMPSGETNLDTTLLLALKKISLLCKPSSLWYCVVAALAN